MHHDDLDNSPHEYGNTSGNTPDYSNKEPLLSGNFEPHREQNPEFLHIQTDRQTPVKKPKRRRGRIIASILIILVLVVTSSMFFQNNDISYQSNSNGFQFSVSPKTTPHPPVSSTFPSPQITPGTAPESGAYIQNSPTGDGTQLVISDAPVLSQGVLAPPLSVKQISKKVKPSVVGIISQVRTSASFGGTQAGVSSGTGIIMDTNGYVITNYHVIENSLNIKIILDNNNEYDATLVGGDKISDLAVLKFISSESLTPAEFGNSDALEVGDPVVAIGNPLGIELRGTVTNGIVSAINRDIQVEGRNMTLLQTNAAMNSGNSGGPLINEHGQVIGINTVKIMTSSYQAVEGLGFAIPVSTAAPIINALISDGYVKGRPAIGITGENIPQGAANYYKMPQGIYVLTVVPDSGAHKAGILEGDIIIGVNGETTTDMSSLNKIKERYVAGDEITLNIYRSGEYFDITMTLSDEADVR